MNTPIVDFIRAYAQKEGSRLHMPGHKGKAFLGCEKYDITEIKGADALYEAEGIIGESEKNATELFGSGATFYSCEGSTQCIKAMVYLALLNRKNSSERPVILAARNTHKAFIYACAELNVDVRFVYDETDSFSLCRCTVSAETLKKAISDCKPFAVYVTSPDYLGGSLDIKALSETAHDFDIPLLVDNAHGAYLKFLGVNRHPLDLGADMCCDSAHKTLPVLTGGAYLHIAKSGKYKDDFIADAKKALGLFGSTSPSYLILQSLDLCNEYLSGNFKCELADCVKRICELKEKLRQNGYSIAESDPLKLTIHSTCQNIGEVLRKSNIECEYADPDFTVLMFTAQNSEADFEAVAKALGKSKAIQSMPKLSLKQHETAMTVREAVFSKSERVRVKDSLGRISAMPTVSCPPAVPVVVSGEVINESDLPIFEHYGIEFIDVVKE